MYKISLSKVMICAHRRSHHLTTFNDFNLISEKNMKYLWIYFMKDQPICCCIIPYVVHAFTSSLLVGSLALTIYRDISWWTMYELLLISNAKRGIGLMMMLWVYYITTDLLFTTEEVTETKLSFNTFKLNKLNIQKFFSLTIKVTFVCDLYIVYLTFFFLWNHCE